MICVAFVNQESRVGRERRKGLYGVKVGGAGVLSQNIRDRVSNWLLLRLLVPSTNVSKVFIRTVVLGTSRAQRQRQFPSK